MGANFNTILLPGNLNRDAVKRQFKILQEQDLHDNGHSYSGGFGMAEGLTFAKETFANKDGAELWVCEHTNKRGPALAVLVNSEENRMWLIGAWCAS